MKLTERVAVTDELLARFLCALYGTTHERKMSVNEPAHAAVLLSGITRFLATFAHSQGLNAEQMADLVRHAAAHPSPITQYQDPAVRRWVTVWNELYAPGAGLYPIDPNQTH